MQILTDRSTFLIPDVVEPFSPINATAPVSNPVLVMLGGVSSGTL